MIFNGIDFKSQSLTNLCQTHHVKALYAFGSVVNKNFTDKSDIDFIVQLDENDPVNRGLLLLSLQYELEQLFNKRVDLLTFNSLRNPYLKESINNSKILVYAGSKEEVL